MTISKKVINMYFTNSKIILLRIQYDLTIIFHYILYSLNQNKLLSIPYYIQKE